MDGRTHAVVGAAAALLPLHSNDPVVVGTAITFGVLGALTPDLDAKASKISRVTRLVCKSISLFIIATVIIRFVFKYDVFSMLHLGQYVNRSYLFVIIGAVGFLVLSIIGLNTPHRGFTHSCLACCLFSIALNFMFPHTLFLPFVIGYVSHLLLDLLNTKGLQLFFPLQNRFCLNICGSSSMTSRVCRYAAMVFCVGNIAIRCIEMG